MNRIASHESLVARLCRVGYEADCLASDQQASLEQFEEFWYAMEADRPPGSLTAPTVGERMVTGTTAFVPLVIRVIRKIVIPTLREACLLCEQRKLTYDRLKKVLKDSTERYGGKDALKDEVIDALAAAIAAELAL